MPLQGKRIVVTRAERQAESLAAQLRALGAEPVYMPVIAFAPPADWQPVDRAIAQLSDYDWLVFTSANGVDHFWQRLLALGKDATSLRAVRVAAIGPATAEVLRQRGIEPAVIPQEYIAEALADALGPVTGQRILLARAETARKALADILLARGAQVDEVTIYRTVPAQPVDIAALRQHPPDAITFTSSSTVRHFVEQVGAEGLAALRGVTIACIGPITAETARALGLTPHVVATEYTVTGLVTALTAYLGAAPPPA